MTPDEMKAAVELAKALAECCRAWEPGVRMIGNLRADEIGQVATALLAAHAECERMRQDIERVVPYVLATLPHQNGMERSAVATSDPEWVAVHRGRAASSARQLQRMLDAARTAASGEG